MNFKLASIFTFSERTVRDDKKLQTNLLIIQITTINFSSYFKLVILLGRYSKITKGGTTEKYALGLDVVIQSGRCEIEKNIKLYKLWENITL